MHDAALSAADAGDDVLLFVGQDLVGEMRVRDRLSAEGHHVHAAVPEDTLGDLGIGVPAYGDDGDADRPFDGCRRLGLVAGSQIGCTHAVL